MDVLVPSKGSLKKNYVYQKMMYVIMLDVHLQRQVQVSLKVGTVQDILIDFYKIRV